MHQVTPADLAAGVGRSPRYFARCFHASFGSTPRRWLVEQRIRQAAHLLRTSPDAIGAIAARCGCDNTSLFSRQFRAVMGCSPSDYRQRSR